MDVQAAGAVGPDAGTTERELGGEDAGAATRRLQPLGHRGDVVALDHGLDGARGIAFAAEAGEVGALPGGVAEEQRGLLGAYAERAAREVAALTIDVAEREYPVGVAERDEREVGPRIAEGSGQLAVMRRLAVGGGIPAGEQVIIASAHGSALARLTATERATTRVERRKVPEAVGWLMRRAPCAWPGVDRPCPWASSKTESASTGRAS
jgi:hypothetical protein